MVSIPQNSIIPASALQRTEVNLNAKNSNSEQSGVINSVNSPQLANQADSAKYCPRKIEKNREESSATPKPYLWVSDHKDLVAGQRLSNCYEILPANYPLENVTSGTKHTLCFNSDTSEVVIMKIGDALLKAGAEVSVFVLSSPLATQVAFTGESFAAIIVMGQVSYGDWLESLQNVEIDFQTAGEIAKYWLLILPDNIDRATRLQMLKGRVKPGMSDFRWGDYIRKLEAEIHAAVDGTVNDPDEQLKLELKALAKETDSIKYKRKRAELCCRYRLTKREVDEEIAVLSNKISTSKAKRYKGKEFLQLESAAMSWLVPGCIPSRGVFLLGGMPGAGKTTLAIDAVGSVMFGEEFLGEKPTKQGKVLLVSSDELPCFTQEKLIDRGIPLNTEDLEVLLDWDISQWDILEETIADVRPVLVVIDSFSSIHRDPNFDENSTQAKNTVYQLESLSNTYGCSNILVHHLSKSKDNKGVAKLRGSTSISAAASVVAILQETSAGTAKVLDFPKMRGGQSQQIKIELERSTGRWSVIAGGVDEETKSLTQRVIDFFESYTDSAVRLEFSEIMQGLGLGESSKNGLYKALERLVKQSRLVKRPSQKNGRFKVFGLPKVSHTPNDTSLSPLPPCVNLSSPTSETLIKQEIQTLDTTLDIHSTTLDTQNPENKSNVVNADTEGFSDIGQPEGQKEGERGGQPLSTVELSHSTQGDEPELVTEVVVEAYPLTWSIDDNTAAQVLDKRWHRNKKERLIRLPGMKAKWVPMEKTNDNHPRLVKK
jgi:hypothetical protein